MSEYLDERPKHEGRVLCEKFDAIVRDHHLKDSTGYVTWGRHQHCEGPHKRLMIVEEEEQ